MGRIAALLVFASAVGATACGKSDTEDKHRLYVRHPRDILDPWGQALVLLCGDDDVTSWR